MKYESRSNSDHPDAVSMFDMGSAEAHDHLRVPGLCPRKVRGHRPPSLPVLASLAPLCVERARRPRRYQDSGPGVPGSRGEVSRGQGNGPGHKV